MAKGDGMARRAVEILKDVLIVALTVSAVWLIGKTSLFTELRGWIAPSEPTVEVETVRPEAAVVPDILCVRNDLGLYGVTSDEASLARSFGDLSPLLGEGLSTMEAPQQITRSQWRTHLEQPGVYCAYQEELPLPVLCAWLGGGAAPSELTGSARSIILSWDGETVWLCWRDGAGAYRRARTETAYEGRLETVLEDYSPNGAAFAYALAAADDAYAALDGDVVVSVLTPQPFVYTASSPDFVHDPEALETLLSALGFRSGVSSAYESSGELALNENGDRLRVGPDGSVTFRAGTEIRYPVAAAGSSPTAAEAARAAWDLLSQVTAPWQGDAAFLLASVEKTGTGWTVAFRTRLDGLPVLTGETGGRYVFTITDRSVSEFSLTLRTYAATGETTLLPSQRLAAAALRSLPDNGGTLSLCYSDTGGGTVTAAWVTGAQ